MTNSDNSPVEPSDDGPELTPELIRRARIKKDGVIIQQGTDFLQVPGEPSDAKRREFAELILGKWQHDASDDALITRIADRLPIALRAIAERTD